MIWNIALGIVLACVILFLAPILCVILVAVIMVICGDISYFIQEWKNNKK